MSPVIYTFEFIAVEKADKIPEWLLWVYQLNPMVGLITLYRKVIVSGPLVNAYAPLAAVIVSVIVCIVGLMVFRKFEPDFADEL
jgi:ABC-type polysaccharide/polyol phosphate export permease